MSMYERMKEPVEKGEKNRISCLMSGLYAGLLWTYGTFLLTHGKRIASVPWEKTGWKTVWIVDSL